MIEPSRSYQVNQEITTLQPDITVRSISYEGDRESIPGIWLTSDSQPISDAQIIVTLFLNDTIVGKIMEALFTTSVDGSFSLELDYFDFLPGNYYWEIEFRKLGYQGWDLIENVVLVPHTYDIRLDVSPELVQGEEFIIVAIVNYNSVDSDKSGQGAPNIEIRFEFVLVYSDGTSVTIIQIATTNLDGVAFITLTPDETKSLQEVVSITATIQQQDQIYTAELKNENLPSIINNDDSFLDRTTELLENNTVLLAFLTVFFASSTIILLITRNKIPLKQEMWPKHEK